MNLKEFFKPTNKSFLYWLILGAAVLAVGGTIWWSTNKQEYPSPDLQILVNSSGYCEQDSDCVLVSKYDGCCRTCDLEAVNTKEKERLERYMETISWCATIDVDCPKNKCPINTYEAVCEENKCVMKEKQQQQMIEIDTSNWKTYRNEEYGFEVKYPEDWSFTKEDKGIIYLTFLKDGSSISIKYEVTLAHGNVAKCKFYSVLVAGKQIEGYNRCFLDPSAYSFPKQFTKEQLNTPWYDIHLPHIDKSIGGEFEFYFRPINPPSNEKFLPIFEKILSTFKFIE